MVDEIFPSTNNNTQEVSMDEGVTSIKGKKGESKNEKEVCNNNLQRIEQAENHNEGQYYNNGFHHQTIVLSSQELGYFDPQMAQKYCPIYPQSWVPDCQDGFYIPQEDEPDNGVQVLEQGADQIKSEDVTAENTDILTHKMEQENVTYFSANPLCSLGMSVEQDKQLVMSYAGMEMMPSIPFPPNYGFQYFYVPYGTPPPQQVIPVMVIPLINPFDDHVRSGMEIPHGNEFSPPIGLLPSSVSSQDPRIGSHLTPSPVEMYQPTMYSWPGWSPQMMVPIAPRISTQVSPGAQFSHGETQIKEANYNNNY